MRWRRFGRCLNAASAKARLFLEGPARRKIRRSRVAGLDHRRVASELLAGDLNEIDIGKGESLLLCRTGEVFRVAIRVYLGEVNRRPKSEDGGTVECLLKIHKTVATNVSMSFESDELALQLDNAGIVVAGSTVIHQSSEFVRVGTVGGYCVSVLTAVRGLLWYWPELL